MVKVREPVPREAFEELLAAHLDELYRTALQLTAGHEADAEDLLQEAALRAFLSVSDLRELGAARSWLFTILVRTHLNRQRTRRRRAEVPESDLEPAAFEAALAAWQPPATPVEELDRRLLRERLAAALDRLAAPLRAVAWLVDVEGFRQREVAEMLEIPEGTVASRLYRARQQLRTELERSGATRRRQG